MDEQSPLANLRAVLQSAKLRKRQTATSVAALSGLSRTTVSQAFNSESVPSKETLAALAPVLGLSLEALLTMRQACLTVPPPDRTRPARRAPAGDADFETRYRNYLKTRHGSLTVVGLDLRGPAASSWPLDAAYLSLELSEPDGRGQRVERAERALRRSGPTLIKGLAGSGKTTLLQWIACTAANGKLTAPDEPRRSLIGFVLPLRSLARLARLPRPEEFLSAVGCPLAAVQPLGWTDRVLSSGRGIILVDGLDEVPEALRDRARQWLLELVAAYPQARFVVTTRPTAVSEGWLTGFRELTVRPMSRADVSVFVGRWHAAARQSAADADVRTHLTDLERDLKEQVRAKRDLANLTTTPLLCALVCALHRDRRGQLPHDRMELYQAALSMFLYRRDHEREVVAPEGILLSETESARLLQKLAYWLIRNGRNELRRSTAEKVLTRALLSMHAVAQQGDAGRVLDHLLARSGLLRCPSADSIDFVHRTFQDFLGAKEAVEAEDLLLIAGHAHDTLWEDVVRMAVAHARPGEAATLLEEVLTRSDREPEHRKRLVLLALACLRHAPELDAEVRKKVQLRAAKLLPPDGWSAAEELSLIGPLVLDLLLGPAELSAHLAWMSVHTAQLIGGDGALAYLKPFSQVPDARVRSKLCSDWDGFDPNEYVAQVLALMPDELPMIEVRDPRQIPALHPLRARQVLVSGARTPQEITDLPHAEHITSLGIELNPALHRLDWLAGAFPSLEALRLADCTQLDKLESLGGTAITRLALTDMPLHGLGDLRTMPALRILELRALDRLVPDRVPALLELAELNVDNADFLDLLDRWPALTRLSVPGSTFPHRGLGAPLPRLRHLELHGVDLTTLAARRIPELPQVSEVFVSVPRGDLAPLTALFPQARTVTVVASRPGLNVDLAPLMSLPQLESLTVRGFASVSGGRGFGPGVVRPYRTL
ncbi:NACHT domain-containing protein [Streptomyces sp. NBC_01367]|uniref:NACHT domain-containing protein n=1 Tax=Streptomyces sp. NBC_01367 TaxID=2903841 RepID=UPI00324B1B39